MHREPVAVAMTVGVDLRLRAGLADERIVRRHRAVVAQAQRFADVVVERLRLHAQAVVIRSVRTELLRVAADAIAIADRDVEVLVLAEEDAAGEVAAGLPGVGDEDLLNVAEHVALEEAARDGQRRPFLAGLRVRDVDEMVLREVGMHGDEVQTIVACGRPLLRARRRWRGGAGDVHTGFGASTPLRMMRSAPLRSVTRIVFASAKAMPHGWNSPVATVTTRILPPCTSSTCGLVSRGGAARPAAASGGLCCAGSRARTEEQDGGDPANRGELHSGAIMSSTPRLRPYFWPLRFALRPCASPLIRTPPPLERRRRSGPPPFISPRSESCSTFP